MPEIRLIDANALYNNLKESAKAARELKEEAQDEEIKIRAEKAQETFIECALRVKNAPTIEPEVQYGEWTIARSYGEYDFWKCGNCKKWNDKPSKFCPRCGSRMYGGDENAKA